MVDICRNKSRHRSRPRTTARVSGFGRLRLTRREFIFFLVTSYLVVIAAGMITHLHALLILSPELPPCPPLNPIAHIILLARVALDPPYIDAELVTALHDAEETLRKGSKSFTVAKLAFGREMRIGLIAVYAWCRVTVGLVQWRWKVSLTSGRPDRRATIT